MKTEILNTNWFLNPHMNEGTITFKGKNGQPLDAFVYGEYFAEDEILEVEFSSLDSDFDWEGVFNGNPFKEQKLVKTGDWKYEGYGKIISINPIIIDFEELELEVGNWSNDQSIIGEFVFWKIDRLDIMKK